MDAAVNMDNFQIQVTAVHDDKLVVKLLHNGVDYFQTQSEFNFISSSESFTYVFAFCFTETQNGYGRYVNYSSCF